MKVRASTQRSAYPAPATRSTRSAVDSSTTIRSVDLISAIILAYFPSKQFDLLFYRIFVYEKFPKNSRKIYKNSREIKGIFCEQKFARIFISEYSVISYVFKLVFTTLTNPKSDQIRYFHSFSI